jgi:repressor LexA
MHTLRALRESKGLLQKEVAEAVGVDRTSYVRYERGDSEPSFQTLDKLARFFNVSADYLLGRQPYPATPKSTGGVWIPVLGKVAAGVPIEAIEDIEDYEEITLEMARAGEYFALRIKGDSMEPRIADGDVVIVREQNDCNNNDVAVVIVNGDEATVKRIKKMPEGIMLIPSNPSYEPMFFSNTDIEKLSVVVIGKVVELRAKF